MVRYALTEAEMIAIRCTAAHLYAQLAGENGPTRAQVFGRTLRYYLLVREEATPPRGMTLAGLFWDTKQVYAITADNEGGFEVSSDEPLIAR